MSALAGRYFRSTLGVAALVLTSAAALPQACQGSCRSLAQCDAQHCAVLSAVQVGRDQPRPVGCIEKERDNAPGVSTYARDAQGVCWIFPTTLVADGFVADDSCSP